MPEPSDSARRFAAFPWLLSLTLIIVIVYFIWRCFFVPTTHTTVYVVRHADKAATPANDPVLSPAGTARAQALAHALDLVSIQGVYATQFQRTQLTGAPTAAAAGLSVQQYNAIDTRQVIQTVLYSHTGQVALVVGHSNTVDDLLSELGVSNQPELSESTYDRLFVVHRLSGDVIHFEALRYGAPTP